VADPTAVLREHQTLRRHHMTSHNGILLRLAALARRNIGWQPDEEKTKRGQLKKIALDTVDAMLNGKEVSGPLAEFMACFVMMDLSSWSAHVENRKRVEDAMVRIVKELPIWEWAETVNGLGPLGLATILGEAGNPSNYATVCKFRKRLGWAPAECYPKGKTGGRKIPRSCKGAVYGDVAMPLFFAQSPIVDKTTGEVKREAGPYRKVYDARRAHTAETHPEWTKGHAHNDAMRVMIQRLLTDLWSAWRETRVDLNTSPKVSPAHSIAAE